MKCIGIIGAMEQEVARIKEKMQDVQITKKASMDFMKELWRKESCCCTFRNR